MLGLYCRTTCSNTIITKKTTNFNSWNQGSQLDSQGRSKMLVLVLIPFFKDKSSSYRQTSTKTVQGQLVPSLRPLPVIDFQPSDQ